MINYEILESNECLFDRQTLALLTSGEYPFAWNGDFLFWTPEPLPKPDLTKKQSKHVKSSISL